MLLKASALWEETLGHKSLSKCGSTHITEKQVWAHALSWNITYLSVCWVLARGHIQWVSKYLVLTSTHQPGEVSTVILSLWLKKTPGTQWWIVCWSPQTNNRIAGAQIGSLKPQWVLLSAHCPSVGTQFEVSVAHCQKQEDPVARHWARPLSLLWAVGCSIPWDDHWQWHWITVHRSGK